jgi:lipoprotein NlpD
MVPRIVWYCFLIILFGAGCSLWKIPFQDKEEEPDYLRTSTPSGTKVRGMYHTVKRGQTLWRIAKTYEVDLQVLAELNNIDDVTQIKAGQKIFIPGASQTRRLVATSQPPPGKPPKITKGTGEFIWPVQGKVVSKFGIISGLQYEGIEIAAPLGAPIRASRDGEVVYAGSLRGYGNLVILKHYNQYNTVYAYNQKNLVSQGRRVKKGDTIAEVGNTGRSSDPRLHFQIRKKNQARNPLFFLP